MVADLVERKELWMVVLMVENLAVWRGHPRVVVMVDAMAAWLG